MRYSEGSHESRVGLNGDGFEAIAGLPDSIGNPPADTGDQALTLLRALAHPVRFRIMQLLADKERFGITNNHCCPEDVVCVCRLLMAIDISPPALSHHLKILRGAHLVDARKDGIWTYYSIRSGVLPTVIDALVQLEPETGSS